MVETVVPPYSTAYTTLNERIVEKLFQIDTNSTEETVRILVNSLICAAKYVQERLELASQSIEEICNTTDEQVAQLVFSVSQQEEDVRQSQEEVNQANINLQHTQHQVNLAEAAVRDGQHSLNVANNAVHEANRAEQRARNCIGRRRKRFLGDLKKILNRGLERPLCKVINRGGISRAEERRNIAEQNLNNARQRLQTQRQNLINVQAKLHAAQTRLHNANIQLQTMKVALNEQRIQQSLLTNISKQFKNVAVHLSDVLSSSTVLHDELFHLVDFENVILPLNNIYEVMLENHIMTPFGFEISANTTDQIKINLNELGQLLTNMPFNIMSNTSSEMGGNCSLVYIEQQYSSSAPENQSDTTSVAEFTSISTTIDPMLGNIIPVYRYHSSHGHFYTTSENEIGTITLETIGKYRYRAEGVAFHLLKIQLPETVPWYRYAANTYRHFYTTNWKEIGTNIQGAFSNGMHCEGIMGYVYPTQKSGTCPLYRYIRIASSQYFYTIHPCEIRTTTPRVIGRHSYKYEGIAAYVPTSFPCPHGIAAC